MGQTTKSEKLTVNDLKRIETGETRAFALPDARACRNGRALAYQFQHLFGCKFSITTDFAANILTITRRDI